MIEQGQGTDFGGIAEAVQEIENLFDDPITILRFASQPAQPGAFKTPQKPQFTSFPATATLVEMNVAAKYIAAGQLAAGDVVLEMRDRLNEGDENIGGTRVADRVIYRGMEYKLVQRPIPVELGAGLSPDSQFYVCHLRRTNSVSDVVGG